MRRTSYAAADALGLLASYSPHGVSETVNGGVLAARTLRRAGIGTMFALPGGHNMPLFRAAPPEGIRLIDTRHEEAAAMMAEGWALATADVGAVTVTAGPGLANAVPGIAEANHAGTPVVMIAGRTGLRQRGRGAVQDLDQLSLVSPITKWREECVATERIPEYVAEAVHRARSGAPGVAYLEIPVDVFGASAVEREATVASVPRGTAPQGDLDRAVDVLASASRPVVVAGSGAFFSKAGPSLRAFAETSGIPVVTTSAARGLVDDDHPRCIGGLVHGGIAVASSDAVLVLGSRFNANLMYGGPPLLPADGAVIQVDVDPDNLGGQRVPDVGIVGDVSAVLDGLTEAWKSPAEDFDEWNTRARDAAAVSRSQWEAEGDRPADGVHPGWLVREVARFAEELGPCTTVADGGDSAVWGIGLFRAHRPGTHMYIGSALGTLGVGLPFAVAAKAARPDEPTILLTGDGALGLSAMELDTAARHDLPVIVVVVNNGGWGGEERSRAAFRMRFDMMAEAVGGHGETVTETREIRPALQRSLDSGVVSVLNVVTDPNAESDLMAGLGSMDVM
jgi:thiamine pyrophosphate-dependent acetolactate synthase large subunit-like protein